MHIRRVNREEGKILYPKVTSEFPFSTTHEIVGKLQKALDQVLEEINELARADPVTPHRFEAVFLSIGLEPDGDKEYMMRSVAYDVLYTLYIQKDGAMEKYSQDNLCISNPVGPLNTDQYDMLHPTYNVVTLKRIYSDVSRGIRHEYLSAVRVYRWELEHPKP